MSNQSKPCFASLVFLGLTSFDEMAAEDRSEDVGDRAVVELLVAERTAARLRKDCKESDRIRDELAAMGVVLKDTKDGTTWEIAT